jgi:hypothetical protein
LGLASVDELPEVANYLPSLDNLDILGDSSGF